MINQKFIESVLDSVKVLGWSAPKAVSEHSGWHIDEVRKVMELQFEEGNLIRKPVGRGYRYAIPGTENTSKSKKHEKPLSNLALKKRKQLLEKMAQQAESKDVEMLTLDEYMISSMNKLEKEKAYTKEGLAIAILNSQSRPKNKSKYDIIDNIAKMVRFGALKLNPYMDGEKRTFQYIIV